MQGQLKISAYAAALGFVVVSGTASAEMPSSPAEKSQTRALNEGSQGGLYTSPSTLNGEGASAQSAPNDQSDAARPSDTDERSATAQPLNPADFITLKTANPESLDQAPVQVASGETVGRVRDVGLAADGTPARIEIVLTDDSLVWVSPEALKFNPRAHLLLTNLNAGDLHSMAARQASRD